MQKLFAGGGGGFECLTTPAPRKILIVHQGVASVFKTELLQI